MAPSAQAVCPNEAIRAEQHSTYLPDCRAYEQVSPATKEGSDIMPDTARTRAAADGSAAEFSTLTGFGQDAQAGPNVAAEYEAVRSGVGWDTHPIGPRQESLWAGDIGSTGLQPRYLDDFSADLDLGVFIAKSPLSQEDPNVSGVPNLYLRDDLRSPGNGHYRLITSCSACTAPFEPNHSGPSLPSLAGTSADFQVVLFKSHLPLVAGSPGNCSDLNDPVECPPKLYEWDHGAVRLVGILPDGEPAVASIAGAGEGVGGRLTPHVLSRDGSRAVFTAPFGSVPLSSGQGDLYLREDNQTTVKINASEKASPDPPQPAIYQDATPDDSQIFFTSGEQLTETPGGGLYRYDVDSAPGHHLSLLAQQGGELGVIGASEDGSYVYYRSGSGIAIWHQGTTHAVAAVTSNDAIAASGLGVAYALPGRIKRARISPDGTSATFELAAADLAGYDNSAPGGGYCDGFGVCSGGGCIAPNCREVYYYDATADDGAGELFCASCNFYSPAASDASFNVRIFMGAAQTSTHLSHSLSDDGRYVFFDTADALAPGDTNGRRDVYAYDSQTATAHLITSGTGADNSFFMDSSTSGRDVFFITRSRLVGGDQDDNMDLYDARVDGGFPEPPPIAAPCAAEACRSPAGNVPAPTVPASSSFVGPGNRRSCLRTSRHCRPKPHHKRHYHGQHTGSATEHSRGHR